MCGISGIIHFDQGKVDKGLLAEMTDKLIHRGPDRCGYWYSSDLNVGLGHRRLSVIDLSSDGDQPMEYDTRYVITYNGEIYNYVELRKKLESKGHSFRSNSDTEVLLQLYSAWGEDCLKLIDGMFAFAIWDKMEEKLFCARDRFGEKPFYYYLQDDKSFYFASEMKALFAAGIERNINNKMLIRYLAHNVVENPSAKSETFYNGILKLEAGHCLTICKGQIQKSRYWTIPANINYDISFDQAKEKFRGLFLDSVRKRLRSDVAVGSSFSGGLDSSAVVLAIDHLTEKGSQSQQVFSARFQDPDLDEGYFMDVVLRNRNISSFQTWPDEVELYEKLDTIFYHQEEPYASSSIFAQWEVMKLARDHDVTVLLDGQGADEVLGGYIHYFQPYLKECYLEDRKVFKNEIKAFKDLHQSEFKTDPKFFLKARYPSVAQSIGKFKRSFRTAAEFKDLHPAFVNENQITLPFDQERNNLNKSLMFDCQKYGLEKLLRYSDRNAMAFSREVRLPFLDHQLVEFLFSLPSSFKIHRGWTKRIMRESFSDILPVEIGKRVKKLGFQPPQHTWLSNNKWIDLMEEANIDLKKRKILKEDSKPMNWRVIMAFQLLNAKF